MKRRVNTSVKLVLFGLLLMPATALAQTGKIAGRVTDAATGEPLPGVNVVIEGTTQGATTDADGYYAMLNVRPGAYDLRASFVGYAAQVTEGVRVNIDLTAEVDFALREETFGLDEVVVSAEEPVVRRDISANVANLSAEEIENIPVASIDEVVGLQAGVEPGMSIRGSGLGEVAFLVDGNSMRDGRNNTPFLGISYTSVDEVQVQTGGFNAEYGNVRSGLVNVVTKEGPRDRYIADALIRYAPPQKRYFGAGPQAFGSYFMRPYLDPEVALEGTRSGTWDAYTQRQYPQWKGWNAFIEEWGSDDNPNNDLSLEQFQELFEWYRRKDIGVDRPDYEIDGTLGGPVPGLSKALGDLRFLASYRQTQSPLFIPQEREAYTDRTVQLKLTSNVARGMKLTLQGMYAEQHSMLNNHQGWPSMFTGGTPRYPWDNRNSFLSNAIAGGSNTTARIWANHVYNPTDVYRTMLSANFTHTLSARTFYEVGLQRMRSDYNTFLDEDQRRDPSEVANQIGSYELDDAPLSYWPANIFSPTGLYLSGHWAKARDSSEVAVWSGRFDITSQLNRFAQVKGGFEYLYSHYDVNHREVNEYFRANLSPTYVWQRTPHQGAAYLQAKLEFQSMVANLGLRADYWYPGGEWYAYDPYSPAFSALFGKDQLDEQLDTEPTRRQVMLSPRLGVSFPITTNSKLFFNYGHFRQMLDPHNLFIVREVVTGAVDQLGNPNHPMPKTVAYELGYEHSILSQFLIRATGYYKALGDQARPVRYINLDETVDYARYEPLNYEDIRGLELVLRKNRGRYVRGFVNFTYMSAKRGNFGFARQYENAVQQREFVRNSRDHYQEKPVPEPFARLNLEFLAPPGLGPELLGLHPLGNWRLNLLGEWRAGEVFTWSGDQTIEGLSNNVRWASYRNLDLRLSKAFEAAGNSVQVFMDVTNALNLRHLRRYGNFYSDDGRDWEHYMMSLHLPEDAFGDHDAPYLFISGDDQPGDFRKPGVAFHPIEVIESVENVGAPHERPLYYELDGGRYMAWDGNAWAEADPDVVEQVLEDKAYVDMPNLGFLNFLNPRMVRFGLRVSL